MRQIINKLIREEDLYQAVDAAFSQGWKRVKLYFLIGLPSETDEDTLGMDQTLPASNPDRSLLVTGQPDEMRYLLPECGTVTLGRGSSATIRLDHPSVSRIHVKLSMTSAGVTVEDNGSHNGTMVNGRRIAGPHLLRSGDVLAVAAVALLYDEGNGIPEDNSAALSWYHRAALQGDADAQNNLGAMFDTGEGIEEDDEQAMHWYTLSANQGNAIAQNNLGAMYFAGDGGRESKVEAYKWFYIAATLGSEIGRRNLDTSAGAMQPAEISEAESRAKSWLSNFADGD